MLEEYIDANSLLNVKVFKYTHDDIPISLKLSQFIFHKRDFFFQSLTYFSYTG